MHQASVAFIAVSATNLILTFSEVRTLRGGESSSCTSHVTL